MALVITLAIRALEMLCLEQMHVRKVARGSVQVAQKLDRQAGQRHHHPDATAPGANCIGACPTLPHPHQTRQRRYGIYRGYSRPVNTFRMDCRRSPPKSSSPAPPDFNSPGEAASRLTHRSCNRPGPDSPEFRATSRTLPPFRSNSLACASVRH